MKPVPAAPRLPTSPIQRLLAPVSVFIRTESAGGLVLMAAAAVALVLANSPWAGAYHHLWETERRSGWDRGRPPTRCTTGSTTA